MAACTAMSAMRFEVLDGLLWVAGLWIGRHWAVGGAEEVLLHLVLLLVSGLRLLRGVDEWTCGLQGRGVVHC